MGAKRVGEIGKADASGTGHIEQSKVIERWIENIWAELDNVVMSKPSVNRTDLDQVRKETWDFSASAGGVRAPKVPKNVKRR